MYASVADLRDEGVTAAMASDGRLTALLDEATRIIDRLTGWCFEPRDGTYRLDGRGGRSIEPPVPPIRITSITVESSGYWGCPGDVGFSVGPEEVVLSGAPVRPGFDAPRITLRHRHHFPRGRANVVVTGRWGYTEDDGTADGRTPLAIRRACLLLVVRNIPRLTDDAFHEARARARVIEEQTRDQRYRLDVPRAGGVLLVGDPEIDVLLQPYVRPIGIGAA